ncbi:MAG: hypothetical protein GWO81_07225 [Verrucomicrobia bacterium]|nr:hypothetical protein [Verrucomicrobiota bacterium]
MNRIYDKILLLIGLLVLVASAAFYLFSDGPEDAEAVPEVAPSGSDYTPIPLPEMSLREATWPQASEQSTGWIYDVFTPPKIYINLDTGEWVSEGWKPPPPPEPYGLYLAEMDRARYRIQILGYIEEDFKDATKSLLLMVDEETGKNLRVRVGDAPEGSDFEVIDFTIERVFGADGGISKRATASIVDLRTDESVDLVHGMPLFTDGVAILLRSDEDSALEWRPKAVGATLENERGSYRLTDIDFEAATLTIEKTFPAGEREPESQTLAVQESNDTSGNEIDKKESSASELEISPFDSMF